MASILSVEQIQGLAAGSTPNTITIPAGQKIVGTDASSIVAPGHVVKSQLWSTPVGTQYTTTSSNWTTFWSPEYTPTKIGNKLIVQTMMNWWADVDNDGQGSVHGALRCQLAVSGQSTIGIFTGADNKVNQGGQGRSQTIGIFFEHTVVSLNSHQFNWGHYRSAGSRTLVAGGAKGNNMMVMEIAQ